MESYTFFSLSFSFSSIHLLKYSVALAESAHSDAPTKSLALREIREAPEEEEVSEVKRASTAATAASAGRGVKYRASWSLRPSSEASFHAFSSR